MAYKTAGYRSSHRKSTHVYRFIDCKRGRSTSVTGSKLANNGARGCVVFASCTFNTPRWRRNLSINRQGSTIRYATNQ